MKIISWNVNGIRAIAKKGFAAIIKNENPDVFCLQETKATVAQTIEVLKDDLPEYEFYGNEATKKGYSGTAIITKTKPISVLYGIGIEEHDDEGRVITAEFEDYFLVTVYVPNSKSGLERLDYRKTWDADFLAFCLNLEDKKPVIVCGDLNVAHQAIDLKNPKSNYNKSAGYTQTEIDGMDNWLKNGYLDSYRLFYPDEVKYSWWSYRFSARTKNIGWRIDYFLVSNKLKSKLKTAEIHNDLLGSDHCPVSIILN